MKYSCFMRYFFLLIGLYVRIKHDWMGDFVVSINVILVFDANNGLVRGVC